MACHELAALRLSLMNILGVDDDAERQHELAELGVAAEKPGPVRSLMQARDLANMLRFFDASLVELQEKVSTTRADDPKMPYLRSLLVLTKSVELELKRQNESLQRLWRDLEEVHDFTHEIYPRD
ncbi:DUF3209 family protein [Cystobacter fuscus]|uniref:DUF3209 family protein n=1 Tax=Cystobacter fuscus TaxID=43 RepID=UPI002B29DBC3|nr:DUF3209 family protein [Cystobacter fuscus]